CPSVAGLHLRMPFLSLARPARAVSNAAVDAIVTQSLSKLYGRFRALDEVNLRVPAGSIFGFLGPNGAGKSTTIRILMGLMKPSAGRASVLGLDCWRKSVQVRDRLGYLPGDIRFYDNMSGRQTLAFLGAARRKNVADEAARLTRRFELDLKK